MLFDKTPWNLDRLVRATLMAGIFVAVLMLLRELSSVLIPFVTAFLLAYLINPMVNKVQEKIPSRGVSVAVTLISLFVLLTVLLAVMLPPIVSEAKKASEMATSFIKDSNLREKIPDSIPPAILDRVLQTVKEVTPKDLLTSKDSLSAIRDVSGAILPKVWGAITGTADFAWQVVGLLIVLLYLIFMLLDFRRFQREWKDLIPESARENVLSFLGEIDREMSRYFRAQFLVASCIGATFSIGFYLIDLPLGILLGIVIGILNMVPYLQALAFPPACLLAVLGAVQNDSSIGMMLLGVVVIFVIAQVLQDAVLIPKIMGDMTGMSPAMLLLSLSVWGKLLGLLGVLIAIPATCLLLAWYRRYLLNANDSGKEKKPQGENSGKESD